MPSPKPSRSSGEPDEVPAAVPDLSVVVVNYNGSATLERCLRSIEAQGFSSKEVVVVDNASTDGSLQEAQKRFWFSSIVSSSNLGFTRAVRLGLDASRGNAVMILGHDIELAPNCISSLIEALEERGGLCMPKLLLDKERTLLNSAGGEIHYLGFAWPSHYAEKDEGFDETVKIGFVAGGVLAAKRAVLDRIGSYDPDYQSYYDDVDLSWRAHMAGFDCYLVPSAVAFHPYVFDALLKREKLFILERNRLFTVFKNYSSRSLALVLIPLISSEMALLAHGVLKGWISQKVKAYAYLISNLDALIAKREVVQRRRTVSDTKVARNFSPEIRYPPLTGATMVNVFNRLLAGYWRLVSPSL